MCLLTKCAMHEDGLLLLPEPTSPLHGPLNLRRQWRPGIPGRHTQIITLINHIAPRQLAGAIDHRGVPRRQMRRRGGPPPNKQPLRNLAVHGLPPPPPHPLEHHVQPGEDEEGAEEDLGPEGESAGGIFAEDQGEVDGGVGCERDDVGNERVV